MKKMRLKDLSDRPVEHVLEGALSGRFLNRGAMTYKKPGERTHEEGRHVHEDDCEAFVILQGKGLLELDGKKIPVTPGDVLVVEPGEDHHLISSVEDPLVSLWIHAGSERHENQRG